MIVKYLISVRIDWKKGELHMECINVFNRFCENNRYSGSLKFNTIFGELYVQIRCKNIIVAHVTTIDDFNKNYYEILKMLQKKILVAKISREDIELNI